MVTSAVADTSGNVYLLSSAGSHNLQVDGHPLQGVGREDYLIGSFNCKGDYRWSVLIGGRNGDRLDRLQTDAEGNIYVSGYLTRSDSAYFKNDTGNDTVLPFSRFDQNTHKQTLFLAKYSASGALQWLRMPHSDTVNFIDANVNSASVDLTTDAEGNSYWLCVLPPGVYANGAFTNTAQGKNVFVLRYDTSGNFMGATPLDFNLPGSYPFLKLAYDAGSDRFFIGGYLPGGVSPPSINGVTVDKPAFLACFSGSDGSLLWKHLNNHDVVGSIRDMVMDQEGSIFITGKFNSRDSLAGVPFAPDVGEFGMFPYVAKLNKDGVVQWVRHTENDAGYPAMGITLNGNEVAITGYENGIQWDTLQFTPVNNRGTDAYLARFERSNGKVLGLHKLSSIFGGYEYTSAITADRYGNYYMGGALDSRLYVNEDTLINNAQDWDFFLAKFGTNVCQCEAPVPNYDYEVMDATTGTVSFTYNGSVPYDSLKWDFGNGDTAFSANPVYAFGSSGNTVTVCVTVSNSCGSEKYCQEIVPTVIGMTDYERISLRLYPNPVTSDLQVWSEEKVVYSIYDGVGKEVAHGILKKGENLLEVHTLPAGYYYLNGHASEQRISISFIKL